MTDDVLRIEIAGTGSESLCQRSRLLIRAGASPAQVVEWLRNGRPIFRHPHRLETWATHRVEEGTWQSPIFRKWKPFPGRE